MVGIKHLSLPFCVAWIVTCRNSAAATFRWHTDAITSVEWHPTDESVLTVSGADDQLTLWDLSLEKDTEADAVRRDVAEVPAQLLFIHQVRDNQRLSRSGNATNLCANLLPRSVDSCADPGPKPHQGAALAPAASRRYHLDGVHRSQHFQDDQRMNGSCTTSFCRATNCATAHSTL